MRQATIDGVLITRPTRQDILGLQVGDLAPNCFGTMSRVTRIYGRGDDIKGKAFVCYYTENGPHSEVSNSLKEDETLATVPLTIKYKRAELAPVIQ